MKHLYLDIETIPCQLENLRSEIWQPHVDFFTRKRAELEEELKAIKPPGNFKDPAKIDEWNRIERPKKEASIKASIEACTAECDAKCDEAWRRTSLDGAYGQIVCIGWAFDDAAPTSIHQGKDCLSLAAEAKLLRAFYDTLSQVPEQARHTLTWIGHNIVDFDLRLIFQRSVVHGIPAPRWIPFDARPWGDRVFDTMLAWAGPRGRVGQDKLCRILGIDAKGSEIGDEIDGSRVWDFVKSGRIADVSSYNAGDVHRAREMHRRFTFALAA